MRITQRQSTLGTMFVLQVLIALALLSLVLQGDFSILFILCCIALVSLGVLTFAYWRGWEYARHAIVIMVTMMVVGTVTPGEPFISVVSLMPPILALVLTRPAWVIGSAVGVYSGGLIFGGLASAYTNPLYALAFLITVVGLVVGRLVLDTALWEARGNAHRTEQALAASEQQATDLARQAQLLSEQNEQQRRLLDLVATLESPTVTLADGVLLAPIVGALDSRRAGLLTRRLLDAVAHQRTKLVILDLSGVSLVDTEVAHALVQTVQALRLLGCEVTITGISASVASTITQLGITLHGVGIARSPQEVLVARAS